MRLSFNDDEVGVNIVCIIGEIGAYAIQHGLPIVSTVREMGQAFMSFPKKPDNNLVNNHEAFYAETVAKAIKTMQEVGVNFPSTPKGILNALGRIISTRDSADIRNAAVLFAGILAGEE